LTSIRDNGISHFLYAFAFAAAQYDRSATGRQAPGNSLSNTTRAAINDSYFSFEIIFVQLCSPEPFD
jgi:hypothetical protein